MDAVEKIAAAVLYEGYLLWPYRRSALKNQRRWTFGGVFPAAFSETARSGDPWEMQTQCLVCGPDPTVSVKVRFLQAVERRVGRRNALGGLDFVEALQVGGQRYLAWDEAREQELHSGVLRLAALGVPRRFGLVVPAGSEQEALAGSDGQEAGALVRSWRALLGEVEIGAREVQAGVFQVTVRISNTTPWQGQSLDREAAFRQALLSTHTILQVEGGEAVSLTDPPQALAQAAGRCRNLHTWPVLAGAPGDKRYVLSSPIILPDYPQIAPESPGELFDNAEIDQLLFLNILALTDEEKREMAATDPRARAILQRTESLTVDDFMHMHGALREFRTLREETDVDPLFKSLEAPPPQSVVVDGVAIRVGSRVRIEPRPGGDIWDIALTGKVAIVEAIDQDYDGALHLAVTVEDDPGRGLGAERMIGHRFYYLPDEVRPLEEPGACAGQLSDKENDHEI